MMDASDEYLGGSFEAPFSLPQRSVRMWKEHGKGHQGAPGSNSPAQPRRRKGSEVAFVVSLGFSRIHKEKCVKREVCFATDVPGSVARTGCTSLF